MMSADTNDPNPWLTVEEQHRPPEIYVYRPPVLPRPNYWLHIGLFLGTVASTMLVAGVDENAVELMSAGLVLPALRLIALRGWVFSASLLSILTAHEFGHYFTARYHRVPASLPYFIPFPFSLFGTLGAVIKMSPRMAPRRALFDIAAAGPLAGIVVALPLTYLGLTLSPLILKSAVPAGSLSLGEPLLFKGLSWLAHGNVRENMDVILHPVAFAGWAGMFVTALNLLPIGQLDGGHVSHALFGARSRLVAFAMFGGLLGFSVWQREFTWVPLMLFLLIFGIQHPPITDDGQPLGPVRQALGLLLGILFVTCFSLVPIKL